MQPGSVRFAAVQGRPFACRRACGAPGRNQRRAYTLLEMMLVLLVVVIAGAVGVPLVQSSLRSQRLKSAAETVRIEWSRAHVKAMKTGRIQVFRYEMGGSQFSIQPWLAADEATETAPDGIPAGFGEAPVMESVADDFETKSLDDGITFAAGNAKFESRAYEVEDFLQSSSVAEGVQWSRPVLFYPDGSASDAFVVVADDKQDAYRVQLRGLTGTSYVSERQTVDELLAAIQPGEVTP